MALLARRLCLRHHPGATIDWVVEEGFAEIATWHPAVGKVIPVAIRRWRKNIWQTIKSGEWRRFKQSMRAEKYDLVIDAQGLLKSAWLTRYVKAPVAGLDRFSAREPIAKGLRRSAMAPPRLWGLALPVDRRPARIAPAVTPSLQNRDRATTNGISPTAKFWWRGSG